MEMNYAGLILNCAMLGLIYALIAFGFTLIFGIARIINFAHAQFYMLGAMFTYYTITKWGWPVPLGIIGSALIVAAIGAILSYVIYRPVRPKGIGLQYAFPPMIISLGMVAIIPAAVILLTGTEEKAVAPYVKGIVNFGITTLPAERLLAMVLALAIFIGLLFFIWKRREGRALSAMSQDIEAAKLNGVNLAKSDVIGFGLGFGLAALSAAILAPLYYVDANIGAAFFLKVFIIVILGGMGSITGTLAGGLIVGFIDGFGQALLPGNMSSLILFVLVVVILAIRPKGLLGKD